MQEMDIRLIFSVLLGRLKWIVASVALGVALFASYAFFFIPEQYTSSSLLYIINRTDDAKEGIASASSISAAQELANNYAIVMKTEPVLKYARSLLEPELAEELSVAQMKGMVSSSLESGTTILRISAKHGDPKTAQKVCNAVTYAIADVYPEITQETSSASVAEDASKAVKTAPNVVRNALIGALVGLVLSVAIVLLREFMDNTIRDKESLQIQVDVPVLGEIPSFTPNGKGGKRHA